MYDAVRGRLSTLTELITPDLPGFGLTPVPTAEPGLDVYVAYVAEQLDRLGVERVVVGGTSMGGYAAMAFVRRFPDRVAGLALIDTRATADAPEGAAGRRAMAEQLERDLEAAPLLEAVFPKLLGTTSFQQRPDVVTGVRDLVARCNPLGAAWAQRAMAARPDSVATLQTLGIPAAVIVGAEDVLTPPSDAMVMADALADVTLVVIPKAGHLTPLEAPDQVVSALTALLEHAPG